MALSCILLMLIIRIVLIIRKYLSRNLLIRETFLVSFSSRNKIRKNSLNYIPLFSRLTISNYFAREVLPTRKMGVCFSCLTLYLRYLHGFGHDISSLAFRHRLAIRTRTLINAGLTFLPNKFAPNS